MKKFKPLWIICLTAALLLLFAVGVSAYTLGDVDFDGSVTASDARLALRAAVGLEDIPFDTEAFYAADVDEDYVITASDARLILRAAVGLEDLGYTVPTEDPRGFIVDMTRDFGIVLDDWYWDEDYEYIWVNFYLDNYTDNYIDFTFFNWGVNRCLTPDYECDNLGDTLVPPHTSNFVTFTIAKGGTPTDFSIAPTGSIAFEYHVTKYAGDPWASESEPLRSDVWQVIWDTGLTPYDSYEPYVSRGWDEWTDGLCAFTFFVEEYDSINTSDDALHLYFLYRNLTGDAQILEVNLLAINDIPLSEYNTFVEYETVYERYTAVIDMILFYNEGTYPSNLAEVGVWPSDVYKVDYELIVRDEATNELLYYDTWTLTR